MGTFVSANSARILSNSILMRSRLGSFDLFLDKNNSSAIVSLSGKFSKKDLIVQVFFDRIQKQKNGNSGLISRIFLIKTVCIDFGKKYGF